MLARLIGVGCREVLFQLNGLRSTSGRECFDLLHWERFGHQYLKASGGFGDVGEHERQQYRGSAIQGRSAHLVTRAHRCEEILRGRLREPSGTLGILARPCTALP